MSSGIELVHSPNLFVCQINNAGKETFIYKKYASQSIENQILIKALVVVLEDLAVV